MQRIFLAFSCLLIAALARAGENPDLDKLKQKPIAVGNGKVGELLRQWWKEGAAAGNAGDFYDNRDGDHSPLNLDPFPQLSAIKYSADDIKVKKHWAAQRLIVPHVTFGNSSTSAPAHLGGSNPRSQYVTQAGLLLLYNQYIRNNLYIYPEHRDHDPGHNGRGAAGESEGYGDLYPTNTPYVIISQGSSGSDHAFMRVMPSVLAAFRPEVKQKLVETGTLMPTIQMLLRSTNKHLKDPKEYLTAKAHPSVFEGAWVDELALVQKAHALELKLLPPMVQLRVIDEDKAVNGIDYFDVAGSEVIGYTPACIARVHRSKAHKQRIVVNADASFDVNKAKLTYKWVLLRGDPDKVKIVTKKEDDSIAEITVAYHDRRPIAPWSPLESNRVDIGVFVHNGTHWSAPSFVTFHTLDRDARVYNRDSKILEIAHGMGEAELRVADWAKLVQQVGKDEGLSRLLEIDQKRRDTLLEWGARQQKMQETTTLRIKDVERHLKTLMTDEKTLSAERKKELEKIKKELEILRAAAVKAEKALLADESRTFVESRIAKLMGDPQFTQTHQAWLKERRTPANDAKIKSAYKKLANFGIVNDKEVLLPLLPGKGPGDETWTRFERAQLEWLHATMLSELAFPGMTEVIWRSNYTDHRLSAPREWRDVFRYDGEGNQIGWMRYSADGIQVFNHEGLLVVEKDAQGRCTKGRVVHYVQDPPKAKSINTNPLRMVPGDTLVLYEYDGVKDTRGRRAGTETLKSGK